MKKIWDDIKELTLKHVEDLYVVAILGTVFITIKSLLFRRHY